MIGGILLLLTLFGILLLIIWFPDSGIARTGYNLFKEKEIPDIVYDIDNESKVVRTQEGFSDLFPKCTLYRKINGKWYKRAWTYDYLHHSKESIILYLLWDEKNIFIPKT